MIHIRPESTDLESAKSNTSYPVFMNIILALCTLVLLSNNVTALNTPIGIINSSNGYLLAWNQGTIANETYFNTSSGLLQFANKPEREKDITYTYGLARRIINTFFYYGYDSLSTDITFNSDNTSFYWAHSNKTIEIATRKLYLGRNNSQGLEDNYVTMVQELKTAYNHNGNYYFLRALNNPDVNSDREGDFMTVDVIGNPTIAYWLNDTGTNTTYNVTGIHLNGKNYSYHLTFEHAQILYTNKSNSNTNRDVWLLEEIGNINANTLYTSTNYWIDAACVITCGTGASVIVTDREDYTSIYINEVKSESCRYRTLRLGLGDCTYSADCNLERDRNTTTGYVVLSSGANAPQRCTDSANCLRTIASSTQNVFYPFNGTGYRTGNIIPQCSISTQYGTGDIGFIQTTYETWRNVSIWKPANNFTENQTKNWTVFYCNWTGISPDNVSLKLNQSYNYTTPYPDNLSVNVSFDREGIWNWTCEVCKFGYCEEAIEGQWKYNRVYFTLSAVVSSIYRSFKYYIIDRAEVLLFWKN